MTVYAIVTPRAAISMQQQYQKQPCTMQRKKQMVQTHRNKLPNPSSIVCVYSLRSLDHARARFPPLSRALTFVVFTMYFVPPPYRYLTGFLLWNVDNLFCPSVRSVRSRLPPPLRPLSQLHGWWHLMAGYATYMQIVSIIHHRQTFLQQKCSYVWRRGVGLAVQREDEEWERMEGKKTD